MFKTRDYFVFDPFRANLLEGWHLDLDQGYEALAANELGWLWCESLGLWLGTWQGTVEDDTTEWLRFYDAAGNLILLPEETERHRAEQERQRAERLAERLRAAGINPDVE